MKVFKFVVFAILVFGISQSAAAQTGKTKSSASIQNLISKNENSMPNMATDSEFRFIMGTKRKLESLEIVFAVVFQRPSLI